MSYTLRATLTATLDVREKSDGTTTPSATEGGNTNVYDQFSLTAFLHDASFPPIGGKVVDLSGTLSGTTLDFDLTAAPWAKERAIPVDKTGKKLVAIILQFSKSNNAAGVLLGPQGTNGYKLFGVDNTPVSPVANLKRFFPGEQFLLFYANPEQDAALTLYTPAVGSGAKDLRFTGTAADTWKCLAIFNG